MTDLSEMFIRGQTQLIISRQALPFILGSQTCPLLSEEFIQTNNK